MKIAYKIAIILISAMTVWAEGKADTKFADESLKYVITYKWGLITKDAGTATLTLKNTGNRYNIRLTGMTKPWADGFFKVRDTLVSVIDKSRFRPVNYTRIAHEGGKYAKDVLTYSYSGNQVNAHVSKFREKKGVITESEKDITAQDDTFDMLSVFYWMRSLDPATMAEGKKVTGTLFSGSNVETVKIWKVGEENVKMRDCSRREAWHLKFTFTSKGGKKTSDDLDAWISKDSSRVPLMIKGSLPIGHVTAYLTN